jgi:methylmalonyl-CoA epimerase
MVVKIVRNLVGSSKIEDNLAEDRYHLPISSEEAIEGTATDGSGPLLLLGVISNIMKKPPRLNHIGIAAPNIPGLSKLFSLLGYSIDHIEDVPEQGVKTHFLPLPQTQTSLELLEPIDPQGVVAGFIAKRGPGVHHLAFEVDHGELETLCERLAQEGIKLIYPVIKLGAHGMRINFIHPSSAGGLLIELMERTAQ